LSLKHYNIKFWILAGFTSLLSGLLAFNNLIEFIKIKLLKQTSGYPFGGEGATPWYYKTADLYAKTNLFFGLLFLVILIVSAGSILKKHKKTLLICFTATILLIFIQILNSLTE